MRWLEPAPNFFPPLHSLAYHVGRRLVFNVGGFWQRYASFRSPREYEQTLEVLVQGALLVLKGGRGPGGIGVSMDPFGALWAEWLLPLQNWDPSLGADPAWDPAVAEYAQLFQSGAIPSDFSGGCVSQAPRESLRFCADMVIRNYAPDSWLFTPVGGLVSLYFHNTTSFGVCILDDRAYDPAPLVRNAERLGLTCEVLGPPAG